MAKKSKRSAGLLMYRRRNSALEVFLVHPGGPSGKIVSAWAFEGDCDPQMLKNNTFMLEWPPDSGRQIEVPEVDRGCWYAVEAARARLLAGQRPFLDPLLARVSFGADSLGPAR
jgi:predicted NUDIX family NTP pyrophosphohydrolase